ncbi:hypothetical protein DOTSEDRAFT_54426 [Dothistroma septosporum NZE10]|uniref:RNase III domain-containing protein n=1 Tax=Dothistroma septosporum (strain NZE10 / CBS 128990) TaxID=675120 RepID=M2Y5Z3_DOTSN|nr:hypothetical protein DOTSEDRAFT_54426 [Dothistroma septosporum NZE10]
MRSAVKPTTARQFTSTAQQSASSPQTSSQPSEPTPRWQQTPPQMRMPIRLRPQPSQPTWAVNSSLEALDSAYDTFIGSTVPRKRGSELLDEETKWLAITHKSFDHGRRGFNDRLAFLGKRILDLQCSLGLLSMPAAEGEGMEKDGRDVFKHRALEGVENITPFAKHQVLDPSRLASLANQYGIDRVVRWKPRKSDDLESSGVETVLAHTIYSVIGALAMQRGGEVAARVARERVLQPLGLR